MIKWILVLICLMLPGTVSAVCTPGELIRIEFRNATPGLKEGSFATKPKVLYRYGDKCGRLEEELDPVRGVHLLTIVNAPEIWTLDGVSGKNVYMVDPDPTSQFEAPVFGRPDAPDFLNEYEFGCELEFMKARYIEPMLHFDEDRELECYTFIQDGYSIYLCVDKDLQYPVTSMLATDSGFDTFIKYLSWWSDPELDLSIFQGPEAPEE